ncbi:MAG: hypothetical protein GWO40_22005 [Gammaproteobacteria bacterium]|nr:hypothetical protein [Gammaproteobacteria bacterium]NIV53841.1 hypothetical protein [Gammaproteobacteria bacterium]NIX88184.1 hypothetical protein [Gammaproteobacteria bacterium]
MRIAREFGVSQGTISTDLKAIMEGWRKSAEADVYAAKVRETEKINRVELEAWEAWEASRQPHEISEREVTGPENERVPGKTKLRVEGSSGDPRFLGVIRDCIAQRCKLWGYNAPDKTALTDSEGKDLAVRRDMYIGVLQRMPDEMRQIVAAVREEARGGEVAAIQNEPG